MSYSSTPQQPSPVMSMVKPDQVSHSPTGAHSHQRGPLQGDLRDMISMYIPGGDTTDSGAQRGYSNIQQHYLTGTAPLTHIWSGNCYYTFLFGSGGPPMLVVDVWTLTWYVKKDEGVWTHGRTGIPRQLDFWPCWSASDYCVECVTLFCHFVFLFFFEVHVSVWWLCKWGLVHWCWNCW